MLPVLVGSASDGLEDLWHEEFLTMRDEIRPTDGARELVQAVSERAPPAVHRKRLAQIAARDLHPSHDGVLGAGVARDEADDDAGCRTGGGGADGRAGARRLATSDIRPAARAVVVQRLCGGKGAAMKAITWHGTRDVRVSEVPEPTIEAPTDAIVRVTSTGLCGSDLHLYEVMGPFIDEGFTLGHEPMGIVEAVGSGVTNLRVGDRVVVPFNISCGSCWMCGQGLQSQCETTSTEYDGTQYGASLFGYTRLYGNVPGGQAELLRVPHANYGPIKVPDGPDDDRFLFLSDVLPTAWQAVQYAGVPEGGSLVVLGLGPIGDMSTRVAQLLGVDRVIGIELVPDRIERSRAHGVETIDLEDADDIVAMVKDVTDGRGPDAVIDAVGMEAHGSPTGKVAQKLAGLLPDAIQEKMMEKAGVDRLGALHLAIELVRRGGTLSLAGVYGGMADPMPMMTLFDKQVTIRMGQANVRRWIDDIIPHLTDADPLGVDSFATHHLSLDEAPDAYATFQHKDDGMIKTVFRP